MVADRQCRGAQDPAPLGVAPRRAALGAHLLRGVRRARFGQSLLRAQFRAVDALGCLCVRRLSAGNAAARARRAAFGESRHGRERAACDGRHRARLPRRRTMAVAHRLDRRRRGPRRRPRVLRAPASARQARLPRCRRVHGDSRQECSMKFGLDRLVASRPLRKDLQGKRVALLGHAASVTRDLTHALDALAALPDIELTAAFGPQHGLRGGKQDNMIESPDFTDPQHGIPVFSLYGEVRRPTAAMMSTFDVLLVDLQDVGCRIYTFITTLRYVLEEAARHGKAVWVLDRPNPVGRPIEGLKLRPGWQSFVGAGPLPMRHGLTMGELARWFVQALKLDVGLEVVTMEGWQPGKAPGSGWPLGERTWVNPSPNAPNLWMAR